MSDSSDAPSERVLRERELIGAARAQVMALRARAEATVTAGEGSSTAAGWAAPPPDSIAGYEILREIHRGGQGVVYQAKQKSTQRLVAVKIMKEGPFAGPADRARFEREVRILGQLKHPNVVTIHDSGVAAGCHYFVMDFVGGRPLDAYMAAERPGLRDALNLFARICDAVNAAHVRGIIHRDLKPSNIRIDSRGEPRVLDFGLAKSAGDGSSAGGGLESMTLTGQFVGSLPWASPEQAAGAPDRIDLRTDVYALGVVLYQMLTGRFPYDVTGPMRNVLERIVHTEPVRPSALRTGADRARIDDEIETILLKCLAKEAERRYQSAGDLGRDVRRYLAGEPIEAKRDSAAYVLRKQLWRYRVPVGIASAFLVLITAGFAVILGLYRSADYQRSVAEGERTIAREARDVALAAERQAELEAGKAQQTTEFLQGILASADPDASRDASYTVREALDKAAADLETEIQDDEIRAALHQTIGEAYRGISRLQEAEHHIRQALALREALHGPEHQEVGASLVYLARLRRTAGAFEEAERMFTRALEIYRAIYGSREPDVLYIEAEIGNLQRQLARYDEAESMLRASLANLSELLGEDHAAVATVAHNLALTLMATRRYDEAEPLIRQSIEIDRIDGERPSPRVATKLTTLATLLMNSNHVEAAEVAAREALEIARDTLGVRHERVAAALNLLAQIVQRRGNLEEAEELNRAALALRRELHGENHFQVAACYRTLASLFSARGDHAGAVEHYERSVAIQRAVGDERNPEFATTLYHLAGERRTLRDYEQAEQLLREALRVLREAAGPGHHNNSAILARMAGVLTDAGRYQEAEPLAREGLAIARERLPPTHTRIGTTLSLLGYIALKREQFAESEALLREALELLQQSLAGDHWAIAEARGFLGACLARLDRCDEAAEELALGLRGMESQSQDTDARVVKILKLMIEMGERCGREEETAGYRERIAVLESSAALTEP